MRYQSWSLRIRIEELCDILSVVVHGHQSATIVVEIPNLEFLVLRCVN